VPMFSSIVSTCFDSFLPRSLGGFHSMLPRSTMSASFLTSIARNISTVASAAPPQKTHAHDQFIGVLFAKILILIISNLRASHLQVVTCRCDGRHANFIPNSSSDLPASAEADRSHHAAAKEIPCKSPNIPSKTSLPPLRGKVSPMCPARCVTCVAGRSLSWWRERMVQELEP